MSRIWGNARHDIIGRGSKNSPCLVRSAANASVQARGRSRWPAARVSVASVVLLAVAEAVASLPRHSQSGRCYRCSIGAVHARSPREHRHWLSAVAGFPTVPVRAMRSARRTERDRAGVVQKKRFCDANDWRAYPCLRSARSITVHTLVVHKVRACGGCSCQLGMRLAWQPRLPLSRPVIRDKPVPLWELCLGQQIRIPKLVSLLRRRFGLLQALPPARSAPPAAAPRAEIN